MQQELVTPPYTFDSFAIDFHNDMNLLHKCKFTVHEVVATNIWLPLFYVQRI